MSGSSFDPNGDMSSNFDPNMFSDFDFSQLMTTDEQNVLRDIMSNADFEQVADGSLNEFDTPTQHFRGVVAPPPTPLEQSMAAPQDGYFDGSESEHLCVFCSAPFDTNHDPDCALVWKPSSVYNAVAQGSIEQKLTPIADSLSADFTVLNPGAPAAQATSRAASLPTPLPMMAPTPGCPTAPSAYYSPYGPSSYPIPTTMPPPTSRSLSVRPASPTPMTQHQTRVSTRDLSSDNEAPPRYQHTFADFDAARQALIPPQGVDPLLKLSLTNDDWRQLKLHHIQSSATRLFDALHAPASPPPDNFTKDQEGYYYDHQASVRQSVLNKVHGYPDEAEARAMLLLEQVINVHEHGVPTSVCNRTAIKSGYILETEMTCSQRLEAVINAVSNDKYVALDVLSGDSIADLARSPARYLRRKRENCRVNARKAFEKQEAEELKRGDMHAGQTPAAPVSRAAKKRSKGKQAAQNQGVTSSPHTPTPSMAASQMSLDPTLQPQHSQTAESARPQLKRKGDSNTQETLKLFKYMKTSQ